MKEIIKRMNNYQSLFEFNISLLKDIILKNYSSCPLNFFEYFKQLILKPSSVNLSLKKIFETFNNNYSKNKYIIIISDGNSKENIEDINNIINESKKNDITIVTLYLSKDKPLEKKIYDEFPSHLNPTLKYLFNISSKVNYKHPLARYLIKKHWDFPKDGQGILFLETNLEELNKPNSFGKDLEEIKYEGIDIKIEDLKYENLIKFKYQFFTKNQIFGTCWANAYSGVIFLTNKRILGKEIETFEAYRENIIKLASELNKDGGNINNPNVEKYFNNQRIYCKRRSEEEARDAIMKGIFSIQFQIK